MNIWTSRKWQNYLNEKKIRTGIRLRFDRNVDKNVRFAVIDFVNRIKRDCYFPIRICVYVKSSKRIKAKDGDMVCGTFFYPFKYGVEPYIRIATGDYNKMASERGHYNAVASILWTLAHELTHYYQYVNKADLTDRGEEWQATYYANRIIREYTAYRDEL